MKANLKTWRRRIRAAALAAVAAFDLICFARPVQADITILTRNFDQSLVPGNNSIPVPGGTLTEQVFLSWPMDKLKNGMSYNSGSYRLSYMVNNGKKAEFTVRKNGDGSADIWFGTRVWDAAASADAGEPRYTPQPPAIYKVYSHLNGGGYKSIQTYLDNNYNVNDPNSNYRVRDDGAPSPYTGLTPHFVIRPDTGFSFNYNDIEIHFRWNSADQRMYFVTNRMIGGRIFEMTLEYSPDMSARPDFSNVLYTEKRKAFTGLSIERFRAIPLANNQNTTTGFCLDIDADLLGYAKNLESGVIPAATANEMILRFDALMEYDPAVQTFSKLPTDPMKVTIEMSNLSPKNQLQVIIDNIYSDVQIIGQTAKINTTDRARVRYAGWAKDSPYKG